RLSDTMEEGRIGRWLKREGESFREGDVIAEIETDKATMEFQAYDDGTVLRIIVDDGETAALGAPIAIVGEAGEEVAEPSAAAEQPAEPEPQPATSGSDPNVASSPAPAPAAQGNGKADVLRVSPIARRMADAAGLDLRSLAGKGSGPDGRIVKADVERALGSATAAPATPVKPAPAEPPAPGPAVSPAEGDEVRQLSPMLKAVARRMTESKTTVPHFYVSSEIDMTRALALRKELNEALADSGEKVSVNDLIIRACAQALDQHPQAHRSYVDGTHVYHAHAHVGIAVALDDGLIVPVLRDADTKSLRQIAAEARDLAERARAGKLRQPEIEGGTFTVSNMGMLGVSGFAAIINPPESAILAVSATIQRPVVRDGAVAVGDLMSVTLSCDHRACSGADGARLLQTVKRHLEAPTLLLA
ncbi:MAG TPA: dihydrolipoamide acetyltransferase family protein, partial [Gaiellales bacterium]|nr:dihydrolipoamide acetyltransferase family protein [Gaiellales bacterium]